MSDTIQLPLHCVGQDIALTSGLKTKDLNVTGDFLLNGTIFSNTGAAGATGSQGIQGIQGVQGPTGVMSNNVTGDFTVSGDLTVTGNVKAATYSSIRFKKLTGTITSATPTNNVNSFTLSGFDSNYTALSSTEVNMPAGIYSVCFSTFCGQPITTTGPVYSQSYMSPVGAEFVASQVATTAVYPSGWASSSSNIQNLTTQVYFPVSGHLQFSFFNNLGATLGATSITATITICCQTIL